jgi:4-hydroxybenzoate polyprenyltransferase
MQKLPICVDVDGTYLRTDILFETLLVVIKHKFLRVLLVPFLFLRGMAKLKFYLATLAFPYLNTKLLPVNNELHDFLKKKKLEAHQIYLVSASNEKIVQKIAENEGIFSGAYGSSESINLKGSVKASFLEEIFPNGFIYIGDSCSDLEVWKKAKQGVVVAANSRIVAQARKVTEIIKVFPKADFKNNLNAWRKELRLYQCVKNLLIFLPLALVHQLGNTQSLFKVTAGFILLSMLASATYILNDLMDLNEDRAHWSKSSRPIASGKIWIADAIAVFMLLTGASIFLSFSLSIDFGIGVIVYFIVTMAYSLFLKKIALLDVTVLAGLFTLRIVLGTIIIDVDHSVWLLSFSFFFFISLAIAKRVTEILRSNAKAGNHNFGRGYLHQDLMFLNGVGIAAAMGAVILMLLYLIDQQYVGKGYLFPKLLWGIPVCVFLCAAKIWMEALRGNMKDDPIIFAFTDKFCLCTIALAATIFLLAGMGI